jgi:hypothetical protein
MRDLRARKAAKKPQRSVQEFSRGQCNGVCPSSFQRTVCSGPVCSFRTSCFQRTVCFKFSEDSMLWTSVLFPYVLGSGLHFGRPPGPPDRPVVLESVPPKSRKIPVWPFFGARTVQITWDRLRPNSADLETLPKSSRISSLSAVRLR